MAGGGFLPIRSSAPITSPSKALRPLSEAPDPEIRAASARSFGEMGGDDVKPDVLRLAPVPLYNTFEEIAFFAERLEHHLGAAL